MEEQQQYKTGAKELRRLEPLTPQEKSRLGGIAQQCRTFAEQLRRFANKTEKTDVATFCRLRGWYEMAEFIADWIQEDERNPKAQIIARTGPSLSELILPHIQSYAWQVGLLAEEDEREFAEHLSHNGNGVSSKCPNCDGPARDVTEHHKYCDECGCSDG